MTLDLNKVIDYIAQGNMMVLILACIILILLSWIKYEENLKRLFSYIYFIIFHRRKEEVEKQKRAFETRSELFMSRISSKITKVDALQLSKDVGRNTFYHFLIRTMLIVTKDIFHRDLQAYKTGKISKEEFCSFYLYHSRGFEEYKEVYTNNIRAKLEEEKWEEEDIKYIINIYHQWALPHFELLAELIASSKLPEEIILSWWTFFYEFYTNLERFSILINGRITGKTFEGLKIGKPSKHLEGDLNG